MLLQLFSSKSREANKKNTITFYLDDIDDSIYHEFLHMASTRETEDDYFSGFFQANYNDQVFAIGRGLNEGYTDVFN